MTEQQYRTALAAAENELQHLRGLRAQIAAFINDPAYDPSARQALAQRLGLPTPRQEPP